MKNKENLALECDFFSAAAFIQVLKQTKLIYIVQSVYVIFGFSRLSIIFFSHFLTVELHFFAYLCRIYIFFISLNVSFENKIKTSNNNSQGIAFKLAFLCTNFS